MIIKGDFLRKFYLFSFALIVALPLLNAPPLFFPPSWGKTIVFRIILSLIFFLFFLQLTKKDKESSISFLSKPEIKLLIGFWLFNVLATIFSQDVFFSVWGSPYRSGGLISLSFFIGFSFLSFLIIQKQDWRKIWNWSLIVAFLVSLIAVFQYLQLFSEALVPYSVRPVSTLGNPIFVAIYLLLHVFLALNFGIKEKNIKKKILYFLGLIVFLYVILITETRAAYLGLLTGLIYFILFHPKKMTKLKILLVIMGILGITSFLFLRINSEAISFDNPTIQRILDRVLSISLEAGSNRISGWTVLLKALKEKPIFGWGPENLLIGFDKYYDPSLSRIASGFGGGWWDRAHNFALDIAVTAGIPALLIYVLFFVFLFLSLQKQKRSQDPFMPHALQATFIAYLTANFFSFDTFSTSLIVYLLIGYSFSLIFKKLELPDSVKNVNWYIVAPILTLIIVFITFFNLKPLVINKNVNWANYYAQETYKGYNQGIVIMEKALKTNSILNNYIRLQYLDVLAKAVEWEPQRKSELALKAIPVLEQITESRPTYTRAWIFLSAYTNSLLANAEEKNVETLKNQSIAYLEKAHKLSPLRREISAELIETYILSKEYQKAEAKALEMLQNDSNEAKYWWLLGISQMHNQKIIEAEQSFEKSWEKGHHPEQIDSQSTLNQMATVYSKLIKDHGKTKYYKELKLIYLRLIRWDYTNFQYHATLAHIYKTLGEFEKARQEALIVLELSPESEQVIQEFLNSF